MGLSLHHFSQIQHPVHFNNAVLYRNGQEFIRTYYQILQKYFKSWAKHTQTQWCDFLVSFFPFVILCSLLHGFGKVVLGWIDYFIYILSLVGCTLQKVEKPCFTSFLTDLSHPHTPIYSTCIVFSLQYEI